MHRSVAGRPIGPPALAFGLAALLVASAGCTRPPVARSGAEGALRAVLADYTDAANARDAEALGALYADDAVLLPPDAEIIEGKAAIAAYWAEGIEPGLSMEPVQVKRTGKAAFIAGRWMLESTTQLPADSGKFVLTLEQGRDGAWRVTSDIWSPWAAPGEEGEEDGRPDRHLTAGPARSGEPVPSRTVIARRDEAIRRP